MLILAIDPGRASPAFCVRQNGKTIYLSNDPPPDLTTTPYDVACVEAQFIAETTTKWMLRALCFNAAWWLGNAVCAKVRIQLLPEEWKDLIYRRGVNINADVFCNRVERDFGPDGGVVGPGRTDQLDALGIAIAVERLESYGNFVSPRKFTTPTRKRANKRVAVRRR